MSPLSEKQEFQNQSGGWLGVVVIGPKGDDRGVSVAPGASVWLSEEEQVLTANAPRRAEDNPFVEQTFNYTDPESGNPKTDTYVPLVPVNTGRYVPSQQRPIGRDLPDAASVGAAQVAATSEQPVVFTPGDAAEQRAAEIAAADSSRPVPPPRARAAAEAEVPFQETDDQFAGDQTPQESIEGTEGPQTPAPQPTAPVEEETAVQQPAIQEETGAAVAPQGEAVAGVFQPGEEVGTPTAPAETAAAVPPTQPAPWTPQERGDAPGDDAPADDADAAQR